MEKSKTKAWKAQRKRILGHPREVWLELTEPRKVACAAILIGVEYVP